MIYQTLIPNRISKIEFYFVRIRSVVYIYFKTYFRFVDCVPTVNISKKLHCTKLKTIIFFYILYYNRGYVFNIIIEIFCMKIDVLRSVNTDSSISIGACNFIPNAPICIIVISYYSSPWIHQMLNQTILNF